MNFKQAIGFMMLGTVFGMLPSLAPGWCPPNGVDGSSTRGLWLEFMSTVLIGIAMIYFARRVLANLVVLLESTPASGELALDAAVPVNGGIEAAVAAREIVPSHRRRPRGILPLPVSLDAVLLEPRRAA